MSVRNFLIGTILSAFKKVGSEMQVEAKDVVFSSISEIRTPNGSAVRVSGFVFHSSLAVDRVTVDRQADVAVIRVFLVPVKRGMSGNFLVDVNVEGISRILFGPSEEELWSRSSSGR